MHHSLQQVARQRFFDIEEFQAFALENRIEYGVAGTDAEPTVSTWHVDDLASGFKAKLGDDFPAHRQKQIELQAEERDAANGGPRI